MNFLEVRNLNKFYGDIHAVKDVSFIVKKGAFFAFLGPNGAGKSTTINIITTLLSKNTGEIILDGYDIEKNEEEIRKKIGIVFQTNMLDSRLSVKENLLIRGGFYKIPIKELIKKIDNLVIELSMSSFINQKYGKLSGGQKRRADIARALIHEPELLILDEPTTGLDPKTRKDVWIYIEKLRKRKMTIFLTTHYMEEASKASDVVIINDGKVVAHGSPEELKDKYSHDTLRLYGSKDEIISYLRSSNLEYDENENIISVKISSLESIKHINNLKSNLDSYELLKGSMDDVFINITGRNLE